MTKPWQLIQGECLPALHTMADESIDAAFQRSALILTPETSVWIAKREGA